MKILFVCSGNIRRSRTASDIFTSEEYPKHEFKSCGTMAGWIRDEQDGLAKGATPISKDIVEWADVIYCMEDEHKEMIEHFYRREAEKCKVLGVVDIYHRGDQTLVDILKEKIGSDLD